MGIFSGGPTKDYSDLQAVGPRLTGADRMANQVGTGVLYSGPLGFTGHRTEQSNVTQGNQQQQQAMQGVGQIAQTGWSGLDSLAQQQAARAANHGEKSQRGAVMQQAQMRGQGGGGAMLAGALAAQQGGANRNLENSTNIAMQGADRRFGANQALGQMGAQYNQQGQQQAASNDAFNQWASAQEGQANRDAYAMKAGSYQQELDQYNDGINRLTSALSLGLG